MRRVRGANRGERRRRTRLVDALVQDLADLTFLVRQHQFGVHGRVQLAVAVVDLQAREPRVHAERACLVGDDRNNALPDLLVAQQFLERPHRRHGGGDLLVTRALLQRLVGVARRKGQHLGVGASLGQEAAQCPPPLQHVADLRRLRAGVVVRREVGVLFELFVADRNALCVTEILEVGQRELLHLVGGVAALEVRAQRVTLDGLGQDDGRLALVIHRCAVRGVHLAVIVAAALEVPDLGVRHLLDELLGAWVAAEEVVADVGAVVGLVGLVVTVGRGVHQVHERAVAVGVQQGVPFAAPHDLDDVPASAAEERLQLLDDLAVAADRAVEALQVAVDDERQVVEALVGRDLDQAP